MDYAALAQALNLDAQRQAQQNPWAIGQQQINAAPVWSNQNSTGKNIGGMALQGFLSGLSGSIAKQQTDSDLAARNESLRGFMSAAPEAQQELLKTDKRLSPFATQLSLMQAEQEQNNQQDLAKRQAALQDKLLERQMGIPLLQQEEGIKAAAKAKGEKAVNPVAMATDLRKELMGTPEYKNYSTVVQAAKNIKELAKQNDPVSNLGLIYSTVKLVDPTSAVKEGEVNMVNLSQGPLARMAGEIQYSINNGGKLQEGTRKKLVEMAGLYAKTAKEAYKTQETPRLDIAGRYGVNVADLGVLPDFQIEPDQPTKPQGYTPQQLAYMKSKGMIP